MDRKQSEVVAQKIEFLQWEIDDVPEILSDLRKHKDYSLIGLNIELYARSILGLGMLYARSQQDYAKCLELFADALNQFDDLCQIAGCDGVLASNFELPIYVCLLSGNMDKARELATSAIVDRPSNQSNYFESSAFALAAYVLDQRSSFDEAVDALSEQIETNVQRILAAYFEIGASVFDGDMVGYGEAIQRISEKFSSRSDDKEFGDAPAEYGGLQENEYVIDFMALGLAAVANKRGFETDVNSEFFPNALLSRICEGSGG